MDGALSAPGRGPDHYGGGLARGSGNLLGPVLNLRVYPPGGPGARMGIPMLGSMVPVSGAPRGMKSKPRNMSSRSDNPPLSKLPAGVSAKRRRAQESCEENPPQSCDKFFVIHSLSETTVAKLSPFVVEKHLKGLVGTIPPQNVKYMRSGDLLVEAPNPAIAQNLLRVKAFGEVPISVTPHRSLNSSRGVVVSRDIVHCTEEELQEGLEGQGVTNVKRIMLRRDGVQIPSRVHVLTFNRPQIPQSINIGYLRCQVRPFIPNPLRCFACQRYGHSNNVCRGTAICARCAGTDHNYETCVLDPVCANCRGAHPAYSRTCPRWQEEKAVQRYRVENNVSYPEARKYIINQPTNRPLYSTAVKGRMVSVEVQTDPFRFSPSQLVLPTVSHPQTSSTSQQSSQTQQRASCHHEAHNQIHSKQAMKPAKAPAARPAGPSAVKPVKAKTVEPMQVEAAKPQQPKQASKPAKAPAPRPVERLAAGPTLAAEPMQVEDAAARTSRPQKIRGSPDPFGSDEEIAPLPLEEYAPRPNSVPIQATASTMDAMAMDVDGQGNSPKKKGGFKAKPKERARVLPPPP